jgi:hypothetical protein
LWEEGGNEPMDWKESKDYTMTKHKEEYHYRYKTESIFIPITHYDIRTLNEYLANKLIEYLNKFGYNPDWEVCGFIPPVYLQNEGSYVSVIFRKKEDER